MCRPIMFLDLSCVVIRDQLIQDAMLPGLRSLHIDMTHLKPGYTDIINSLIKEFNDKIDSGSKNSDRYVNFLKNTV